VTFKSYQGQWVILVFYPGDFTFICPTELADLGRLYREFKKTECGGVWEVHNNSLGRKMEELLRKLHAAVFVRENGGHQVCPSGWKPGAQSLKPGVDLVGRI
jgi:alkyl hydroperoxide reductase subunit AhpC